MMNEIICFLDSSCYAVSNQWNINSVSAFIEHSKNLGYQFEAVVGIKTNPRKSALIRG